MDLNYSMVLCLALFFFASCLGLTLHSYALLSLPLSLSRCVSHAGSLQLSAKNVGVFEAFYNSIKPVQVSKLGVVLAVPISECILLTSPLCLWLRGCFLGFVFCS